MTRVIDGLEVATLYTSHDLPASPVGSPGAAPYVRGVRPDPTRWQIRQRHDGTDGDVESLNAAIVDDLAGGVEAIELAGVDPESVAAVLDGVMVDVAPISLAADTTGATAWALIAHWGAIGLADDAVVANLGIDPLGAGGRLDPVAQAVLVSAAATSAERFPSVRSVGVDASRWARRGVSPADELGLSMATAVEYLRTLVEGGLTVDAAVAEIEFTYLATADQFVTMAKFRAARRLWSRVVEVCGADPAVGAQRQRAITAPIGDDPWADVLRATTACFAAGVGGAQAVTVGPFVATGTDFTPGLARRLARNTQHLLLDESHAASLVDPAGGAPYVETLTDTLARRGWERFRAIEADGAMAAAVESGLVDTLTDEAVPS